MNIQLSEHFNYRKLFRFTMPSIAMMIFTSIYSVVDGYFISNYAGKTPFAAINLIFPIIMILNTVGFMFGTGGTALVAKTFGEGDKDRANQYFSLIVYFAFGLGVVFSILGEIFIKDISIALGADGELLTNCITYGRILFLATPFFVLQVMFQSFFVAAEKPHLGFRMTLISGIINMILDAVLVLSFPQELKLVGAALATLLAQVVGGVVPLIYFLRKNSSTLKLGRTKFYGKAIIQSSLNGMSEFMSNISMNIVGIFFNSQLMLYAGEDGVAAYGVIMYVSFIFVAMFIGYSIGVSPIISYNYGSQNTKELKSILKKSMNIVLIFGASMILISELTTTLLAKAFVSYDINLYNLTVRAFRIYSLAFGFMGFGIFTSSFFTALNDGLTSAIISFMRTLVFEIGAVMLLPLIFDIDGIWYSIIVSELLASILAFIFLTTKRKKYNY